MREVRPNVLEPIVHIESTAPAGAMGDISGKLASRRSLVAGSANGAPRHMVVRGQAPLSELSGYQLRRNALTAGQGRYTLQLSHHEAVPPSMQSQLMAQFNSRASAHDND